MEDKNYYDWLEISKKASPEVIEKAYKALVKKYHPDLQEGDKRESEEIIKKINEAYDVLSDPIKKSDYDSTLVDNDVSKEDYDKLKQELNDLKQNANYGNNQQYSSNNESYYNNQNSSANAQNQEEINYQQQLEYEQAQFEKQRQAELAELEYQRQVENARQKAYHDAYIQDLRNRGYKIRYKKTPKDYLRIAITIVVIILVFFALFQLPFVKNWFNDLYNNNEIIKFVVDTISNIFNGLFKT